MNSDFQGKPRRRVVKKLVFLFLFALVALAYVATPVLAAPPNGDNNQVKNDATNTKKEASNQNKVNKNAKNGKNAANAKNGKNGKNAANAKNGKNGKNAANAKNGKNGKKKGNKNAKNGKNGKKKGNNNNIANQVSATIKLGTDTFSFNDGQTIGELRDGSQSDL